MDRVMLFENLMVMAAADGRFTEEEVAFLAGRAQRWGISDQQIQEALAKAEPDKAELVLPAESSDQVELLREMILIMAVDGELHETEKRLCATAAAVMNVSSDQFDRILDSLL